MECLPQITPLKGSCREREERGRVGDSGGKIVRVRAYQGCQRNQASYIQQQQQNKHELAERVAAFTEAALIWPRWGPGADREIDTSPHPYTQKLPPTDNHS